jgi:predicted nucleic acid-binding protein
MILIDANILVSAVAGRTKDVVGDAIARNLELATTLAQFEEAWRVLTIKLHVPSSVVEDYFAIIQPNLTIIDVDAFANFESAARARLHDRAEPDWPLLAAALAYEGEIWSHDRDFFGVGVPIWSTRNMCFAEAA